MIRVDIFRIRSYRISMPPTLDALAHDALILPPDERVALAYRLLVSVEPGPEPGRGSGLGRRDCTAHRTF